MEILVITVSDRAAHGTCTDRSGPAVRKVLQEAVPEARVEGRVVSDEPEELMHLLREQAGEYDVVLTTGGTGIGPRDRAPEVTREFCDREIPGIAEYLRFRSLEQTAAAVFSRGVAGVAGTTVIVNLPGSVRGAAFCAGLLAPLLEHARDMVRGEGHGKEGAEPQSPRPSGAAERTHR